jgi:hypothetical protein
MAETPNDKPKNPNIQRPAQPSNNKASEQKLDKLAVGIGELNKTLKEILGNDKDNTKTEEARFQGEEKEDRLKELMMRKNLIGVKKSVDKNTEEITKTIKDSTKKTAEETKEGKDENKKFLSTLTGMFDGIKKSLSGATSGINLKPLLAVWTFFKKMGKLAVMFGVGGILSMVKFEDIEKVFKGIGEMFSKMVKFFKPILKEIGIYLKETGLPATMTFLLETFKLMGETFDKLGKNFKGWTESGWADRTFMLVDSIEILGEYVIGWAVNVTNLVWNLFGYKGKVTEDVRKHFQNVFGPSITENIITLFSWVAGLMTVTQLFGPRFLKPTTSMWEGGWWRSAYFLFRQNITRLLLWAAGLVVSWPVAAAATVALITVEYGDKIFKAVREPFLRFLKFWQNLDVDINNWAIKEFPKLAKILGWKEKGKTTFEEDEVSRGAKQRENLAKAQAEVKRLEEWKLLSTARPGEVKGKLFDSSEGNSFGAGRSADMRALDQARYELKRLELKMHHSKKMNGDFTSQDLKDIVTGKINVPGPRPMSDFDTTLIKKSSIINPSMSSWAHLKQPLQSMDLIRAMNRAKISEDFMSFSYADEKGKKTRSIGYGFNLGKPGAEELLKKAGIKHTLKELWAGTKGINKAQAATLQRLEAKYYKEQSMKFAGNLWGGMSAMQKEALWDMSYQMGSLMQNTGLKTALVSGNNEKILWEIMKNSLYGTQTPGRARENAEMLMYQNRSGSGLGANESSGGANSTPVLVAQDYSQHNNGDSNMISSGNSAYQNKDIVSQRFASLKTS